MRITASDLEMVRRIAQKLIRRFPKNIAFDDLYADGLFGLLNADRTFDPSRGVPFRQFATTRIRGAMLDGMRDRHWLPRFRNPALECRAPGLLSRDMADVVAPTRAENSLEGDDAIRCALRDLPRRRRLVLQLSYLESLPLKQIAACLKMTEAGVSLLRKRAIEECRLKLRA